jgi:hypothetical protein
MLSSKLWRQYTVGDKKGYEELWHEMPEQKFIAQSRGKARMIELPKKNDKVAFVYKGEIVMKGIVLSEGFEDGNMHKKHSCNVGNLRPHAENLEFARVEVEEVGLHIPIKPTGQRTWLKFNFE